MSATASTTLPLKTSRSIRRRSARRPRRIRPDRADIASATALLARAKRPLILVGGGIHLSAGHEALLAFAEAQSIPVAHTMSGKGGIACTHRFRSALGRYSRIANELIEASDCFWSLAASSAKSRQALWPARGVDPADTSRHPRRGDRALSAGDGGAVGRRPSRARDLAEALAADAQRARVARGEYIAEIPARMAAWRRERHRGSIRMSSRSTWRGFAREFNGALPADSILVADGGFAGHWTGLLYDTKAPGRHFIPDRGLASIGYGLPRDRRCTRSAHHAGRRDHRRWRLQHDAGANSRPRAARGRADDRRRQQRASGYVKALQHAMFRGRYQSSDLIEMDYAAIARAMGCRVSASMILTSSAEHARGPRRAQPTDRARRRRHPRTRPACSRRRQPHCRDQTGRPVA